MKEENKKIIIGRWFVKAQDDELSANSILTHRDGAPSVVCFLSQQIAEKSLKALVIFFDLELEKVHDLIKLSSLIKNNVSGLTEIEEDSKLLNRYYIETRYVGDYPEFSWEDAEKAFEAATKIKNFVLEQIK